MNWTLSCRNTTRLISPPDNFPLFNYLYNDLTLHFIIAERLVPEDYLSQIIKRSKAAAKTSSADDPRRHPLSKPNQLHEKTYRKSIIKLAPISYSLFFYSYLIR